MAKVKTRSWLEELARRSVDSEDLRKEYEQNLREHHWLTAQDIPSDAGENAGEAGQAVSKPVDGIMRVGPRNESG